MAADIDSLLSRLYHPELKVIEPGLERSARFLKLIGSPHQYLPPVLHVAGTNGKGSLLAYVHAIFEAAGFRVHRYISPHLVDFNERILLDGQPIDDEYLRNLLESLLGYIEEQPVTFFEATTAAAFLAFAEHPADILLLETGMGGRLDATNMVDHPLLTAITPVSLDHCHYLGNSVTEIAFEKAGIMKRSTPCVVGRQAAEAAEVIARRAGELNIPLYRMGEEWQLSWQNGQGVYQSPQRTLVLEPSLAGRHQYDNAATAVACIDRLPQFFISDDHIVHGLASAVWPARLQHLEQGRYVRMLPAGMELWLDGGHNPHGAQVLAQWLSQRGIQETYLICGMVQGKDTGDYLKALVPYVRAVYCLTIPDESLSQPGQEVEMAARAVGMEAHFVPDVENALQTIAHHAKTPAIVCICGSLYLAGKVLAANKDK